MLFLQPLPYTFKSFEIQVILRTVGVTLGPDQVFEADVWNFTTIHLDFEASLPRLAEADVRLLGQQINPYRRQAHLISRTSLCEVMFCHIVIG